MSNTCCNEIWMDIPDYEGLYQVSNLGNIKSFKRKKEKILTNKIHRLGYYKTCLAKDNINKMFFIHRLVLLTFKPKEYFEGAEVNHKNGIKNDNMLENLEWCTRSENIQHSFDTGLIISRKGESHHKAKLTELQILQIREYHKNKEMTILEMSKIYNVHKKTISKIINNKIWKHI